MTLNEIADLITRVAQELPQASQYHELVAIADELRAMQPEPVNQQLLDALQEWSQLANHLKLSTENHRKRTAELIAAAEALAPATVPTSEQMLAGAAELEALAEGLRDAAVGRVTPFEEVESAKGQEPRCELCHGTWMVRDDSHPPIGKWMNDLKPCPKCKPKEPAQEAGPRYTSGCPRCGSEVITYQGVGPICSNGGCGYRGLMAVDKPGNPTEAAPEANCNCGGTGWTGNLVGPSALERMRCVCNPADQLREQAISFAYGNLAASTRHQTTREKVAEAYDKLHPKAAPERIWRVVWYQFGEWRFTTPGTLTQCADTMLSILRVHTPKLQQSDDSGATWQNVPEGK